MALELHAPSPSTAAHKLLVKAILIMLFKLYVHVIIINLTNMSLTSLLYLYVVLKLLNFREIEQSKYHFNILVICNLT